MKILKVEVKDSKIRKNKGYPFCRGEIIIGNFRESFYIMLDTWSLEQYKQQWKEGLTRIKTHDSSCIVASISTWKKEIYLQIYYLYKVDNKIFVQFQMPYAKLFKKMSKGLPPFNTQTCYQYVRPLKFKNEEGTELETWEADLDGIVKLFMMFIFFTF